MYITYSQTVEVHYDGDILDTKILPCPIHPNAQPNTSPYALIDKNIKCPDGSVICWNQQLILQSFSSGRTYIWWNPDSILRQLTDPSLVQSSYYRRFPTGEVEARYDGRSYMWSRPIPGSPLQGLEIESWWDQSNELWQTNRELLYTESIEKDESLDSELDFEIVPCQGCGDSMPKDDVNQYRTGYWCSRACAFYEWMN
jgi:hypothetical protein